MTTEDRNPRTTNLDALSTIEVLDLMNREDAGVAPAIRPALPDITRAVEAIADRLRAGGRLIYVGAGTSGRLAMLDSVELVPTFSAPPGQVMALVAGGEAALTRSIEGAEDDAEAGRADLLALGVGAGDAVLGLAASGSTPYVIGALRAANEVGALTIALSGNDPAPILDLARIKIAVPVGPEVITGSTRLKAGTAQKLVLNLISTAVMVRLGKVYGNLMVDVQVTNAKLARRAEGIVAEVAGVSEGEARSLLEQSGHEVKTAIVVALLGGTPDEARRVLADHRGILRKAIG